VGVFGVMDFMVFVAVVAVFGFILCSIAYLGLRKKLRQIKDLGETDALESQELENQIKNLVIEIQKNKDAVVKSEEKLQNISKSHSTEIDLITGIIRDTISKASSGDLSVQASIEQPNSVSSDFIIAINDLNEFINLVASSNSETTRALTEMHDGNIGVQITTSFNGEFDDTKNNINQCTQKFAQILKSISSSSNSVYNESTEVKRSFDDLVDGLEQQSSSLQLTVDSIEQITQAVDSNVESIQISSRVVGMANKLAHNTEEAIKDASSAMSEIEDISTRIKAIIGVIDDIAFQTNLLALNASVEAARAGEMGRGFGVVADEVRNLAGRAADAAKEIKGLVEESVEKVANGVSLANVAAEKANEVTITFIKASDSIDSMAESTSEQAIVIGDINSAISRIDSLSKQNHSLLGNAIPNISSLYSASTQLKKFTDYFKIK
jgi:methyl-accepting chemotaxis protein